MSEEEAMVMLDWSFFYLRILCWFIYFGLMIDWSEDPYEIELKSISIW